MRQPRHPDAGRSRTAAGFGGVADEVFLALWWWGFVVVGFVAVGFVAADFVAAGFVAAGFVAAGWKKKPGLEKPGGC